MKKASYVTKFVGKLEEFILLLYKDLLGFSVRLEQASVILQSSVFPDPLTGIFLVSNIPRF